MKLVLAVSPSLPLYLLIVNSFPSSHLITISSSHFSSQPPPSTRMNILSSHNQPSHHLTSHNLPYLLFLSPPFLVRWLNFKQKQNLKKWSKIDSKPNNIIIYYTYNTHQLSFLYWFKSFLFHINLLCPNYKTLKMFALFLNFFLFIKLPSSW